MFSLVTLLSVKVQTRDMPAVSQLCPIAAGPTPDSHSHMFDSYCPTNDVKVRLSSR